MKKDIKLIAMDLDGTLLDENLQISDKNKNIIAKLHDEGIKIVLSTGRPFNGHRRIREELNLVGYDDYSICNTGGFVRRNADAKIIIDNSMKKDDYEKIKKFVDGYDLQIALFSKDVLYNNSKEVNEAFKEDQETLRMPRQKFMDFDDIDENIARINFMGKEDELDRFYKDNKEKLEKDYLLMRNETYSLEVLQKGAGKANSLRRLCRYLDIELSNVMYFGDGANDRESLELAGVGIAMKNASQKSIDNADEITKSNDDSGVAHFLEKYFE